MPSDLGAQSAGVTPPASSRDLLHRLQSITDLALSQLDLEQLLPELLDRVRDLVGADTAAVLLMEESREFLLATAARGLEEEVLQGSRVPVGRGFAGQVAATRRPVVLDDVTPRNVVNPVLIMKGIRSMLGVPLLDEGGEVLGVLHVGSLVPRSFTDVDVAMVQQAADRAATAVGQLRARQAASAARSLQRGLLPARLPSTPGVELAARYVPGGPLDVGGDWYDVFRLDDDRLGVAIGDVMGHGLDAAVVMGRLRSVLRAFALEEADPARVLTRLDNVVRTFEADQMATVIYAVYDTSTGVAVFSSAGHLPPVIGHDGSAFVLDLGDDIPLGVSGDFERHSTEVLLLPGTQLCLYTDGLIERRDRDMDTSVQLLRGLVGRATSYSAYDLAAEMMADLIGGDGSDDDIALLVLRRQAES